MVLLCTRLALLTAALVAIASPRDVSASTAICLYGSLVSASNGGLLPTFPVLNGVNLNAFEAFSPYDRSELQIPRTLVATPRGVKGEGYYAIPRTLPDGSPNPDFFMTLFKSGPMKLGNLEYTREQTDILADLGLIKTIPEFEKAVGKTLNRNWSKASGRNISMLMSVLKNMDDYKRRSFRLVATTGKTRTYRPEEFDFLPPRLRRNLQPFQAPDISASGMVVFRELNGVKGELPVQRDVVKDGVQNIRLEAILKKYRNGAEYSRWLTSMRDEQGHLKMGTIDNSVFYASAVESTLQGFDGNSSPEFVTFVHVYPGDEAWQTIHRRLGFREVEGGTFDTAGGGKVIAYLNTIPRLRQRLERQTEELARSQPVSKPKPITPSEVANQLVRPFYMQMVGANLRVSFGAMKRNGEPVFGAGVAWRNFDPVKKTFSDTPLAVGAASGAVRVLPENFHNAQVVELTLKSKVLSYDGHPRELEVVTYVPRASGAIDYSGQYLGVKGGEGPRGLDNVTQRDWRISSEPGSTAYDYHTHAGSDPDGHSGAATNETATFGFQNMVLFDQMVSDMDPKHMELRMQDFHGTYPTRFRVSQDGKPGEWQFEDVSRALTYENTFQRASEDPQKVALPPYDFRLLPGAVYPNQEPTNNYLYSIQGEPDSSPLNGIRLYGDQRPRRAARWILEQNHRFDQVDLFDVLRALHFQFQP
jgi:hypothetical protein